MATQVLTTRAIDRQRRRAAHWAQAALALGTVSSVVFMAVAVFCTISDGRKFTHTADYWFTGIGIPTAIAGIVLLFAVHALQGRRDGRLGSAGLVINSLALLVLAAQLADSVALGEEVRWGPSYPVATAATFIGVALFAAGSWRVGLLPRWMLAIWPVVWVIGSFAAQGPMPLLLAAFYIAMAIVLTRRVAVME
jgi:hypothetical protein